MAEKKKNVQETTENADGRELSMNEMKQVAGGGNPFAEYERVPNQQYDSEIRKKV